MSELTKCNYCSLKSMEWAANQRGVKLIIGPRDENDMIPVRYSDKEKPSAWFLALTDHCVC